MVTTRLPAAPDDAGPSRIYAVGDVHGHLDRLRAMHDAIRRDLAADPTPDPLLVHLGDYIDRGPDSAGCLALLAGGPPIAGVTTVNLMGNHEHMLLCALDRPTPPLAGLWLDNGGGATLASWGIPGATPPSRWAERIPAAQLDFLHALPLSHAAGRYLFVHAGVRPGVPLERQTQEDLLWIRSTFLEWDGVMLPDAPERLIVHGHTPFPIVDVRPNRIGLDTNAGRGGPLSCAVLGPGKPRFLQA